MEAFLREYWLVIVFYVVLIALIYFNRRKFEWQGRIVALLRTNTGLRWMERTGKRHSSAIRIIASIGVIAGFIGMIVIVGYLAHGLYTAFFVPTAPPVISPVLPGVSVPGSPVTLPLFEGLLALFVVIVIHEAAHGLVGAAYGMRIMSSGLVLFGPIPGAFVEPDEKKLTKEKTWTQLSVFAAGPWSNMLLALVALGIIFLLSSLIMNFTDPIGIQFTHVQENSPAALAGLPANTTFTSLNGEQLTDSMQLSQAIRSSDPGDSLTLATANDTYTVTLGKYDAGEESACIGVSGLSTDISESDIRRTHPIAATVLSYIESIFFWIFALSLGLGLANLLPIGPIDGGRMIQLAFREWLGKKKGDLVWTKSSMVLFIIVLILLVVPILRALFTDPIVASCLPL